MMKKYLTLLFVTVLASPFISFADEWSDQQIRDVMSDVDSIRTHTGGNPDYNPVLKQLQDDAAARAEDDRQAREDAKKALDGVSEAEKKAITKAENDRKAAEKNAKDHPYEIEVPEGTVMPAAAVTAYQADRTAAKKTHDDARVAKLRTANTNAATRITTRNQNMQTRAAIREKAYKDAVDARVKSGLPALKVPKFYN